MFLMLARICLSRGMCYKLVDKMKLRVPVVINTQKNRQIYEHRMAFSPGLTLVLRIEPDVCAHQQFLRFIQERQKTFEDILRKYSLGNEQNFFLPQEVESLHFTIVGLEPWFSQEDKNRLTAENLMINRNAVNRIYRKNGGQFEQKQNFVSMDINYLSQWASKIAPFEIQFHGQEAVEDFVRINTEYGRAERGLYPVVSQILFGVFNLVAHPVHDGNTYKLDYGSGFFSGIRRELEHRAGIVHKHKKTDRAIQVVLGIMSAEAADVLEALDGQDMRKLRQELKEFLRNTNARSEEHRLKFDKCYVVHYENRSLKKKFEQNYLALKIIEQNKFL